VVSVGERNMDPKGREGGSKAATPTQSCGLVELTGILDNLLKCTVRSSLVLDTRR